jgi:hypothetical protein
MQSPIAPVSLGIQISQAEIFLQIQLYASYCPGDFASDKRLSPDGRLVVKQYAIAGKDVIGFSIVNRDPVSINLCSPIGTPGIEWCRLLLGDFQHLPIHLAGRSLVKSGLRLHFQHANSVEQAQCADGICIGGVLRGLERNLHVALNRRIENIFLYQIFSS